MSGNHKQGNRLGMDLSFYAPSFRLKQLAWSGYGFGHTSRRRPGDVRGTAVGKRGRFRSLGTKEEVMLRERSGKVIHDPRPHDRPVRGLPTNLPQTSRLREAIHRGRLRLVLSLLLPLR